MKPITKFLRRTEQSYVLHDYKKDCAALIEYSNMLAEKTNELNQEVEELKKEIAKMRRINNLW